MSLIYGGAGIALDGRDGLGGDAFERCALAMADFGAREARRALRGASFGARVHERAPRGAEASLSDAHGVLLAADVRLHNRAELIRTLGLAARAPSDAELVLAAWRRWAEDCPRHLVGEFAFALWDARAGRLFCARDALGVRPFFYRVDADQCLFASALTGLVGAADTPSLNTWMCARLLIRRAPPEPRDETLVHGLMRLPAAHAMHWSVGDAAAVVWQYWQPGDVSEPGFKDPRDYLERLRELLEMSVRDHVRDRGRVGVHASGGLDSSTLAALVRGLSDQPPLAYSWQPPPDAATRSADPLWGEYDRLDALSRHLELPIHHVPTSPEHIWKVLHRDSLRHPFAITQLLDEPVQRRAVDDGVDVIVSGWGGDQGASYLGRGGFADMLWRGHWRRLIKEATRSKSFLGVAVREILASLTAGISPRRHTLASMRAGPHLLQDAAWEGLTPSQSAPLSRRSMHERLRGAPHIAYLTRRIEAWHDSGARRGIDYAYPLLDRRLIDFVAGVPAHMFRRDGRERWLFRAAVADWLPAAIVAHRSKRDPILYGHFRAAFLPVFAQAMEVLRTQPRPPDDPFRHLIDYPRLIEQLEQACVAAADAELVPGGVPLLVALALVSGH